MNKEQQIYKMKEIMCNYCGNIDGCKISCRAHKELAEALYNAGYRIIPEGYHVELKTAADLVKETDELLSTIKEERANAVKEFAERLKEYARACKASGYDGIGENDIDDLLKEDEQ